VVIVSQVGEVEGLSLREIGRSTASTSFGEEGGASKYLQPADIRPMIILSDAGTQPCKNARRIRSRLRSMSDYSECSSRIRFFASSRVKRPISNVSRRRDVQHTIRRRWHACGSHRNALPRTETSGDCVSFTPT
jgi:hypothetical protein